jgi:hypothetical protein
VICCAIPAVWKRNIRKDSTARRAPKGRRLVTIWQRGQECNISIRNRGSKAHLGLRMWRKSDRNYRTHMQLQTESRIVCSTTGVQDVTYWTFWKVRPPPKGKKDVQRAQGPEALKCRSLKY